MSFWVMIIIMSFYFIHFDDNWHGLMICLILISLGYALDIFIRTSSDLGVLQTII